MIMMTHPGNQHDDDDADDDDDDGGVADAVDTASVSSPSRW